MTTPPPATLLPATNPVESTATATSIASTVEPIPSLLQASGALLLVLGLIALVAWLFKRFAFNGQLLARGPITKTRQLQVKESLWLDARYRVVVVQNGGAQHTLLLGPQQALQLQTTTTDLQPSRHES